MSMLCMSTGMDGQETQPPPTTDGRMDGDRPVHRYPPACEGVGPVVEACARTALRILAGSFTCPLRFTMLPSSEQPSKSWKVVLWLGLLLVGHSAYSFIHCTFPVVPLYLLLIVPSPLLCTHD